MNPIFQAVVFPILKKLVNYAILNAEDYVIEQIIGVLDKNGDNQLSKQEIKEYKQMVTYFKKYKPLDN